MKSFIFIALTVLTVNSVQAAGLQAIKGSKSKITITDSAYENAINGKSPACVKNGSSVIGVNEAFNSLGLKYKDCSEGDGALAEHEARGIKVTVIKVKELSLAKRKELFATK